MKTLRSYQSRDVAKIRSAWTEGVNNVLYICPTGGGKTVTFSSIVTAESGPVVVIAHRREILGQISMALAENKTPHAVIAPGSIARYFGQMQREKFGRSYVDPRASVSIAGVDTLNARAKSLRGWADTVRLWVQDEAHHVQIANKWGKAAAMFPNARGLGVTATGARADGAPLKRSLGGVFDDIVIGPKSRDLERRGYLSPYRIYAPPSSLLDIDSVPLGTSGDFKKKPLTQCVRASRLVGDIVSHYLKLTPGKCGATFLTDTKTAKEISASFNRAGVVAAELNSNSPVKERGAVLKKFASGKIRMLVNVDLFGEGFDLPALEVVIFGRPTASFTVYQQQFGRVRRTSPGKIEGIVIDAVGNVARHNGPPDRDIDWRELFDTASLVSKNLDEPPFRVCAGCLRCWEGYSRTCPHCGTTPEIRERSSIEQVEGDLIELDEATLAYMRGEVARVDSSVPEITEGLRHAGAPSAAIAGLSARHRERQAAQIILRKNMELWGGRERCRGLTDSARHIKFYNMFGVDVLNAQSLGRPDAEKLNIIVMEDLKK